MQRYTNKMLVHNTAESPKFSTKSQFLQMKRGKGMRCIELYNLPLFYHQNTKKIPTNNVKEKHPFFWYKSECLQESTGRPRAVSNGAKRYKGSIKTDW